MDALTGLHPAAALRCLVPAWRGAPHELIAAELRDRAAANQKNRDWDLDRFDVTTLPQVLSWCLDSGPFSAQLELVLDRIEPFLPDPRAAAPLSALAAKLSQAQSRVAARVSGLAQLHELGPSSLSHDEVVRRVQTVVSDEQQHHQRLAELLTEESVGRRAVLADWFMSRGDPLGEFVGLQLARGPAGEPSKRELTLWEQYGVEWIRLFLGPGVVKEGIGSVVRGRVRFSLGVPLEVDVEEAAVDKLPAPGWVHVRGLVLRRYFVDDGASKRDRAYTLARAERLDVHVKVLRDSLERTSCAALRELILRGAGPEKWPALASLVERLPGLHTVEIDPNEGFNSKGLTLR